MSNILPDCRNLCKLLVKWLQSKDENLFFNYILSHEIVISVRCFGKLLVYRGIQWWQWWGPSQRWQEQGPEFPRLRLTFRLRLARDLRIIATEICGEMWASIQEWNMVNPVMFARWDGLFKTVESKLPKSCLFIFFSRKFLLARTLSYS